MLLMVRAWIRLSTTLKNADAETLSLSPISAPCHPIVAVAELKKKAGTVACSFPGAWQIKKHFYPAVGPHLHLCRTHLFTVLF
jgi:hypothetical protein